MKKLIIILAVLLGMNGQVLAKGVAVIGHKPHLDYKLQIEDVMIFVCVQHYTDINPDACVSSLRKCVINNMSQKDLDFNENVRAFNSLLVCINQH